MGNYAEDSGVRVISPKKLTTHFVLGEGAFGVVYKGSWTIGKGHRARVMQVAVKVLKDPTLRSNAWHEVKRLNALDHPNILTLFGVCSPHVSEAPWIVTEFLPNGDLYSYILSLANPGMSSTMMIKFAYGICCGMEYLHDEGQRHGDLAARNCLVGPNCTVKIGDFGMFDSNNKDCYYTNSAFDDTYDNFYNYQGNNLFPCPIRWMPPENLPYIDDYFYIKPSFTQEGDVWAYGVVLFELWSRAARPFHCLDNDQVLEALASGKTPQDYRKICAKVFIRNIMDRCWNFSPQNRPTFEQLQWDFQKHAGHLIN